MSKTDTRHEHAYYILYSGWHNRPTLYRIYTTHPRKAISYADRRLMVYAHDSVTIYNRHGTPIAHAIIPPTGNDYILCAYGCHNMRTMYPEVITLTDDITCAAIDL